MSFLDYWGAIRPHIDDASGRWIADLFDEFEVRPGAASGSSFASGKRLRGCLVCLVCEALDGRIDDALARAAAVECIQSASLIHDDYVDGDRVRRNRPALWTQAGPREAVLLADVVFATVIERMSALGVRDGAVAARAIAAMARGAYQEYRDRRGLGQAAQSEAYRPEWYETVICRKTGSLFEAAAELGAIAADAAEPLVAGAARYGTRLGEAYQIADDLAELRELASRPEPAPEERAARERRTAALMPALLYFSPGDVHALRERRSAHPDILARIEPRMREAIGARVRLALEALARFPHNAHTELLHEMPHAVVEAVQAESAGTATSGANAISDGR